MSWKSRGRKKFFRLINSLEKTEIFQVDQYIVINEYAGGKTNKNYNRKWDVKAEYAKDLASGRIKSFLDFDNYYNPDLTLNTPFEKDEKKAYTIVKKALYQIGEKWEQRLKEMFPQHKYTLVMYFETECKLWVMDFFNGPQEIKDSKNPERFKDIFYFHK